MARTKPPKTWTYRLLDDGEGIPVLHLTGVMDAYSAGPMIREIEKPLRDRPPAQLHVDLGRVEYLDDFGVLVLIELRRIVAELGGRFALININPKTREMLDIWDFEGLAKKPYVLKKKPSPNVILRLGDGTLRVLFDLKYLVSFIGSVCLSLIYVFIHPKALRVNDVFSYMQKVGVDALPIVGLISFLLGLIMAFMSSVQLEQFGANIYVASLVSLAMTRELGPIMTAIIVAGRSGSSFAAEIGTMKISEEVDALFTMGFDPTRFLVTPKIIATVIVVPLLTIFSDLFAIGGGLIVGILMLDLTANAYLTQTVNSLAFFDVFWGFIKSAVFAFLIAWIGCLRGFQVRGGAASVGEKTTSAVVTSIFMIILLDSIFAVILRYWGG